MSKVAIFPASGALGSSIYTHLLSMIDPKSVILISRHPEKVPPKYLEAGVTTRKADYDSPETLDHVFDDVSCLILVSYPSIQYEHRFEAHKAAIDAARRSKPGVSHIFYTSLAFGGDCTPVSVARVMQGHLATESYLASIVARALDTDRPFAFTVMREGIYSESFALYTGFYDLKNPATEVRLPHDGSGPGVAWAKRDELGEASARLVKSYLDAPRHFEHRNQIVLLSGPKSWSIAETLQTLARTVGREVKIARIGTEAYIDDPRTQEVLRSHGPDDPAKEWATTFEAVSKGETDVVSGDLERLLGRKPEAFEETVGRLAKG